jgi:beta-galactosidase
VGLYSGRVSELVHHYVRPQENGNRSAVRWVCFSDENGEGLRIRHESGGLLNVSAWPYSMEDLEAADHPHELPVRDYITVNIDHAQEGVGGDLPGFPWCMMNIS